MKKSKHGVRLLLLAAIATVVALTPAVADGKRVTGEWAIGGTDPDFQRVQMSDAFEWLIAERAALDGAAFTVTLTDEDRRHIGELPCEDCNSGLQLQPLRVGVVKPINDLRFEMSALQTIVAEAPHAGGVFRLWEDGFSWTARIDSPEANALRLQFSEIRLPAGAELWIYGGADEAYGPISAGDMDDDAEYWSPSVSGDHLFVQLRYFGRLQNPGLATLGFGLTAVGHVGSMGLDVRPDPGTSEPTPDSFCGFNASCVENASCSNIPGNVAAAEDAVAHMQWISGAFINICSGGLLADTDGSSQRPLFLTANHCLSRGKDAKNLETFWKFTTNCGGSCPQQFQDPPGITKLVGSSVLATGSTGDFTLLELKQAAPSGSFFMGWNNTPIANSNGAALYRIHHPGGAPQAYSEHSVDTSARTCLSAPRGDWIYSRDTYGATEGGSSGSPVMNSSGEVVGQLTGACGTNTGNVCDSASNATLDGALAAYYSSVEEFLDPQGGGGGPGGSCDNDGVCESGEDCTNCGDCDGVTGGRPTNRYCCGDGTAQSAEGDGSICDGNY